MKQSVTNIVCTTILRILAGGVAFAGFIAFVTSGSRSDDLKMLSTDRSLGKLKAIQGVGSDHHNAYALVITDKGAYGVIGVPAGDFGTDVTEASDKEHIWVCRNDATCDYYRIY